jgi:hypothetical protein
MSDTRGFHYALTPVKDKCEWDMNEVMLELSELNGRVAEQQSRLQALGRQFEAVRAGTGNAGQPLDLAMRQMACRYLADVQQQISAGRHQVRELETVRDHAIARSHSLRKFADHLDEHRTQELTVYRRAMAQKAFGEADDSWLQRVNWRKAQ